MTMPNFNSQPFPGLVVSGTHSSVGKSSVATGLMRLLQRRGHSVHPFKAGPDHIDPGHHERACGTPSYNLDSFMCTHGYLRDLFSDRVRGGGITVVEGMMGLFDGAHPKKDMGSTAEIAKLFDLPVLLVFDGQATARSAAALVQGFVNFDPGIRFLGVVANRVNSAGHADILKQAIEHHTAVPFLGHLPQQPELEIASRHLGLHQGFEQEDAIYERWADHIERHLDMERLLPSLTPPTNEKATSAPPARWKTTKQSGAFSVAVAKDAAFQFAYPDTLDLFRHAGGDVRFFSPLADRALPEGIDWVYLPGGYPESYAPALSANQNMLASIRRFAQQDGVVVGECGGLMVLGKTLTGEDGKTHPMAGLFDFSTTMQNKRLTLGYRTLAFSAERQDAAPLILKGHEFHYSRLVDNRETPLMLQAAQEGNAEVRDGFRHNNCFALYMHLYWGSCPDWLRFILQQVENGKQRHAV